jgi:hypothetical protein
LPTGASAPARLAKVFLGMIANPHCVAATQVGGLTL